MKLNPSIQCTTRNEWRDWLQENHASQSEVWLHYFKKHTGKASVTYRESVEEALCFGWIDGMKRRVDDERYAQRFTPRKARSKWSPLNIRLAEQMIAEGRMTGAGLSAFRNRIEYDDSILEHRDQDKNALPEVFSKALADNPSARESFEAMAPGYRRQYAGWIGAAKREDTRVRRAAEVVQRLLRNKKPGMK